MNKELFGCLKEVHICVQSHRCPQDSHILQPQLLCSNDRHLSSSFSHHSKCLSRGCQDSSHMNGYMEHNSPALQMKFKVVT